MMIKSIFSMKSKILNITAGKIYYCGEMLKLANKNDTHY